jgi:hypothetical protein
VRLLLHGSAHHLLGETDIGILVVLTTQILYQVQK